MNFKFLIMLNFFAFSAHSGKSTHRFMQSTCYHVWLMGVIYTMGAAAQEVEVVF